MKLHSAIPYITIAFLFASLYAAPIALPDFDEPVTIETPTKQVPQSAAAPAEAIEVPINFAPIEASSVSDEAAVEIKKIPAELNRPIRVGVFTDVKELYIIRGDEDIRITPAGKKLKVQGNSNTATIDPQEFYSEGKCISIALQKSQLKSACYPGYFYITVTGSKLTAINILDVEEYIRGVIPYEIGTLDSSRVEALKAQAVAARTYAYKHFGSREALGFDVYADTKDQVYKGLQSATPLTDAAVKNTEGEVMIHNGEFITAYYHSTCGGETETMATWSKPDIPYLRTKPDLRENGSPWCDESSYTKWERRFSDKEIVAMIKQNAKEAKMKISDFSSLQDIVVKDTLESGRILTLQVITDKGTFEFISDKTRWLFKKGEAILPSSYFRIAHENGEWILTGKGFGHGVGMCQMGVRARAQAGQSYAEILKHYYTGITLERFEK